jgi:hypothetical protein
MLFSILALGIMIAVHLLFSGDLERSTKLGYWLVFFIGGFLILYVFNAPFISALFKIMVAVAYLFKGHSVSNSASGV